MIRYSMGKAFVPASAAVAVLLSGCGLGGPPAEPTTRRTTSVPDTSYAGPLFDSSEPALPGGVRVLSKAEPHLHVKVRAGRYAVRLSPSLLFAADVPDQGMVFAGAHLVLPPGSDGQLFVSNAPRRTTALPAHPCVDHQVSVVGPTTRDLADALSHQQFFRSTGPVPATVGGADGFFVKLVVPDLFDVTTCSDGRVDLYTAISSGRRWSTSEYGMVYRLWVVQVGGRRLVLQAEHTTGADSREVASLMDMVESLSFVREPRVRTTS